MRLHISTGTRSSGMLACFVFATAVSGCTGSIGNAVGEPSATGSTPPAPPPTTTPGTSDAGEAGPTSCNARALPRMLQRIPNRRYTNAVRDLLGLAEGPRVSGGGGTYDSLVPGDADDITTPLGFEYAQTAETVAARAPTDQLAPCPTGMAERTCAQAFVDRFASRAFRRPIVEDERNRLLTVYDAGRTEGDYATGIRLVIEAVLEAPSFLYRKAIGAPSGDGFALDDFEIASELGFFFFDSLPDEKLFDAAASGKLATDDGFAREVDRLLSDPKAQDNLAHVMSMWFGGNHAASLTKDGSLFPEFGPTLEASLVQSKDLFLKSILWDEKGTFTDLLSSPKVWIDQQIGAFLGVAAPPSGFSAASLPDQRSGILTQPALLAWLASANETSVVHRGLFVFTQLLCMQTAPPPPGALEIAAAEAKNLTTERQRAAFRARRSPCNGCHSLFDPMGLVFEGYDPIGRFRSTLDGAAVDTTAEAVIPSTLAGHLQGAADMTSRLAKSPEVALCAAKQVMAYALAQGVTLPSEECVAEDVESRFLASGSRLSELFRAVASTPGFRHRSGGGT